MAKDIKQLEKELDEMEKNSEKLKKELEAARTGVAVDGRPMKYLEVFSKSYLDAYKKLVATLSEENQEKIGFGNNKYTITVRYGRMNHRTLISYTPAFKRSNVEFIIVDDVMVNLPNGLDMPAPATGCIRNDMQNGPHHLFFGTTDPTAFTEEFANKQAQEFFTQDITRYLK
jgi:hypothetical protein